MELYFWALLIVVILSWVAPMSRTRCRAAGATHGPRARTDSSAATPAGASFPFSSCFALTLLRDYLVPGLALEVGIPRMLLP